MSTAVSTQPVEWLGMRFGVPAGWEIARHAVSEVQGGLVFVDRRDQRLSLHWTTVPTAPDSAQSLLDCRNRDLERNPGATFSDMPRVRSWKGYRWTDGGTTVTRAGFYDRGSARWIEAVFTRAPEGGDDAERMFLETFETSTGDEPDRRWQAFGMDVTVPKGWKLTQAKVLPGDCTLGYGAKEGVVAVRRIKVASAWNSEGVGVFIGRQLGSRTPPSIHPGTYGVHESCTMRSREQAFAPRWLLRGRRHRMDTAWHCARTDAVYQITTTVDPGADMDPATVRVRCCAPADGDIS